MRPIYAFKGRTMRNSCYFVFERHIWAPNSFRLANAIQGKIVSITQTKAIFGSIQHLGDTVSLNNGNLSFDIISVKSAIALWGFGHQCAEGVTHQSIDKGVTTVRGKIAYEMRCTTNYYDLFQC